MRRAVVAGEYKNEGKGMEVEVEKEAKRIKKGKKKKRNATEPHLSLSDVLSLSFTPSPITATTLTGNARRNLEEDAAGEGEAGDKGPAGSVVVVREESG